MKPESMRGSEAGRDPRAVAQPVAAPLTRAAIFLVLQDYISSETENWMSFIGLFFVLVVLFFPRGVLGIIRRKATS